MRLCAGMIYGLPRLQLMRVCDAPIPVTGVLDSELDYGANFSAQACATLRSFSIRRSADLEAFSVYQTRKTGRFPESWSVDIHC